MSVRYIQVESVSNLFAPAVRAYGNIAILGDSTPDEGPTTDTQSQSSEEAEQSATPQQLTSIRKLYQDLGQTEPRMLETLSYGDAREIIQNLQPPTPQQLTSIRKLYQGMGQPEPENQGPKSYADARELIKTLSVEYLQKRKKPYETFTDPDAAIELFPNSPLGKAIKLAFQQTPGPTVIYGIPVVTQATDGWQTAFNTASNLDVQLVVLANTPTTTGDGKPLQLLSEHVTNISKLDGKERIGVAMLPEGVTDVSKSGIIKNDRMVYIAHKSKQDAAAAVAGTIAGYEPPVSLLLKPVNIKTDLFTPTEIVTLNGVETFTSGPAGQGVNWLTSPALLPGGAIYMGEGYTGNPGGGKKFIDIVRTIDDISFKLKARLIQSIGVLRISRVGLRTVIGLMEAVLEPYVRGDVLGSYTIGIPLLVILDKDPSTRTPAEIQQLTDATANRLIEIQVTVKYQAAIHRLAITLKIE